MADEDDWGFPVRSGNDGTSTTVPLPADDEDDWGFIDTKEATKSALAAPALTDDGEDEWGFSTSLSKDAALKLNKTALDEDEWGLPNHPTPAASSDPSDLLSKWGFDSEPSTPKLTPESTNSSLNVVESLFEGWKTATRTDKLGTSLSTFTSILSKLDIRGPQHLLELNLKQGAVQIGQGSQFTVFKDRHSAEADDGSGQIVEGKGIVIKRVRISKLALRSQKDLGENELYLQTLRNLELEVLSLGLIRHRNVVKLTGWGYDYEDRYTPIPVLFMEAALIPLTEFLQAEKEGEGALVGLGNKRWDIKYQLALDVASGLETLHGFNIIHGDIKPDNVLVFREDDPKVPYVGKLSDFGVCIDMRVARQNITSETFLGTPSWTGSEVGIGQWKDDVHGTFSPELLKNFDSYSFGLLLLSIFGTCGDVPEISKEPGPGRAFGLFMEIEEALEKAKGCPEDISNKLKEVSKKLLSVKPSERPLPSPTLLQTSLPAYDEWLRLSATSAQQSESIKGRRDHAYWFNLDMNVLKSLDEQYTQQEKKGQATSFTGEVLFGMAEAFSQSNDDWRGKFLKYVQAAAKKEYVPATAICGKIYDALEEEVGVDEATLKNWESEAIRNGFMFDRHPFLDEDKYKQERQDFRGNGGYCDDPFLTQETILTTVKDADRLTKWLASNKIDSAVDSAGNTIMHVSAAIGHMASLRLLVSQSMIFPVNEKGENPLYKACQAGHTEAVHFLLKNGHRPTASIATDVSPLHWLFLFPEPDIREVAEALVKAGIDVNSTIRSERSGRAKRYQMKHFPFEWPHGTPFHWAAFARSTTAMERLLELGANINPTYANGNHATTPLARAVYTGDTPLVQYLLGKGADVSMTNKQGENLLHIMSCGAGNESTLAGKRFDSYVRHGNWDKRLRSAKDVIRLLLDSGVAIEGKVTTFGKYTPLFLAASHCNFRNEYVLKALIDTGANTNKLNTDHNTNILHEWCDTNPEFLQYPQAHKGILQDIIRRTEDLDVKGGAADETALHVVVQRFPTNQSLEYIKLLLDNPAHHADINARDRDGNTVLMKTCSEKRIKLLFEYGARPEVMNDYQENFLHNLNGYCLMDADSLRVLELLFSHKCFTLEVRDRFIAETNITALERISSDGRLKTLEYLLKLGMGKRVNEKIMVDGNEATILDQVFFAADLGRFTYIRYASELLTEEEIQEADRNNQLYTTSVGAVHKRYNGPSANRAREAYWAYPKILKLLQSYGAERFLYNNRGPTWTDATKLPAIGMKKERQPNLEHWEPLYELDVLQDGWEEEAWEIFKDEYSYLDEDDLEKLTVPVMIFERWPQVVELLPSKNGWYSGLLRDGRCVRVKMEDGKIMDLTDMKGRYIGVKIR